MPSIDPSAVEALLREVAAEHILPLFKNLDKEQIRTKSGPTDMVTDADVAAERVLTAELPKLLAGSQVIGEEGVAEAPETINALNNDGAFWIVDPVDGTRNFVNGSDSFGMIVALVVDGVTRMGWIYMPTSDECLTAELGAGAFLGGRRLSGRAAQWGALVGEYSANFIPKELRAQVEGALGQLGEKIRIGSAAHGYARMAMGSLDYVIYGQVKPWDHAAGALIVTETGGRVAFMDDAQDYTPQPWPNRLLLSVGDAAIWDEFRQTALQMG